MGSARRRFVHYFNGIANKNAPMRRYMRFDDDEFVIVEQVFAGGILHVGFSDRSVIFVGRAVRRDELGFFL